MSDDHSDPQSAPEPSRPIVESIAPDEPKTPAWLTWVGFALFLLVIGWFAARCSADESSSGATAPAGMPAAPLK